MRAGSEGRARCWHGVVVDGGLPGGGGLEAMQVCWSSCNMSVLLDAKVARG